MVKALTFCIVMTRVFFHDCTISFESNMVVMRVRNQKQLLGTKLE